MNAKKAKAIRKAIRDDIKRNNRTLPENGLVYKDTQKQVGWSFPPGWKKPNFLRLMVEGKGSPWYNEALGLAKRVFARQAIQTPGSFKYVYKRTKRLLSGS